MEDPSAAARAAGLRYVNDGDAGMLSTLMTREREAAGSAEAGSRRRSAKSTTA